MATLVNTTFFVTDPLKDRLIGWLKENYIPSLGLCAAHSEALLSEIMTKAQEGATGLALQHRSTDADMTQKWMNEEGAQLLKQLSRTFGENVMYFTTYMQIIE